MERRNLPVGIGAIAFSLVGTVYIIRSLARAVETGTSPGRLGAVHPSGSVEYTFYVGVCLLGIVLMAGVAAFGARWSGLLKKPRSR